MRRAVPLLVLLASACGVSLDDYPGRTCDEAHPCRAGRSCLGGFCFAPGELDGGSDAGAPPDAGRPDAGAPDAGTPDAGVPTWQQWLHGFTATTLDSNCSVVINPGLANTVSAAIASARDTEDTATADMNDPSRLPRGGNGRFRGRVSLSAPLSLQGLATFALVGTASGTPYLSLGFNRNGRLVVSSAAGTVGPAAITQAVAPDGGFRAGDYIVDVAWRQGGTRRVFVDDVLLDEVAVPAGGAATGPEQVRLGIERYDGDAGTGWSVVLSNWKLADDQSVPLGGPP